MLLSFMPMQDRIKTVEHTVIKKIILTLTTNGILRIINAVTKARTIPSITLRRLKPNIRLDSSTFGGMIISMSFSSLLI